jgi:hypothetical protein
MSVSIKPPNTMNGLNSRIAPTTAEMSSRAAKKILNAKMNFAAASVAARYVAKCGYLSRREARGSKSVSNGGDSSAPFPLVPTQ